MTTFSVSSFSAPVDELLDVWLLPDNTKIYHHLDFTSSFSLFALVGKRLVMEISDFHHRVPRQPGEGLQSRFTLLMFNNALNHLCRLLK